MAQVQNIAVTHGHRLTAAEAHSLAISWDKKCESDKNGNIRYADVENSPAAATGVYPSFYPPHFLICLFSLWQASRRMWTCLCGNSLYFFNNAKDTHVSFRPYIMFPVHHSVWYWNILCVCVTVCGEAGPQWVCVPEGWLQPGQKPWGSQTHSPHEGWRDQTHSKCRESYL